MDPFIPHELPIALNAANLITLTGRANARIAEYDGLLQGIPNPEVLLSPLVSKEAVASSKIEGTQATLKEVMEHEAGEKQPTEKEKDIQEILNYRTALLLAKDVIKERPITRNLVLQTHKVLMNSVRGKDKTPGQFRIDQNWIGPIGCKIENATFVPTNPLVMQHSLEKWEKYLAADDVDPLIQTAVMHAQFEIIHPFNDGNGRIGRLLIPLYLCQKKSLKSPAFFLSSYLEKHNDEYKAHLGAISKNNKWTEWVEFFLKAVIVQATQDSEKVRKIFALYDQMTEEVRKVTRSQYTQKIVDYIFAQPIFGSKQFAGNIPAATKQVLLKQLKDAQILTVARQRSGRRPEIVIFSKLLRMLNKD